MKISTCLFYFRNGGKHMRLAEGKTYKDYYVVIEIDGVLRNICKSSGST